jgi:hypothetical protein
MTKVAIPSEILAILDIYMLLLAYGYSPLAYFLTPNDFMHCQLVSLSAEGLLNDNPPALPVVSGGTYVHACLLKYHLYTRNRLIGVKRFMTVLHSVRSRISIYLLPATYHYGHLSLYATLSFAYSLYNPFHSSSPLYCWVLVYVLTCVFSK